MSNTLNEVRPLKIENFIPVVKGKELLDIIQEVKAEVEIFTSREPLDTAISALYEKQDDKERTLKVLQAIRTETLSVDELLIQMMHREEFMRMKAVIEMTAKLKENAEGSNEEREINQKLKSSPNSLIKSLRVKNLDVLKLSVKLLAHAMEGDELRHSFRALNGFPTVSRTLSSPYIFEDSQLIQDLLTCVFKFTSIEENLSPLREANIIPAVVPYLNHGDEQVVTLATRILRNMGAIASNVPMIGKCDTLPHFIRNSIARKFPLIQDSLVLMKFLAMHDITREIFTANEFRHLMTNFLNPEKAYAISKEITNEHKANLEVQKLALEIILESSSDNRTQKILASLNIISPCLMGFFLPMKTTTTTKWNFEILMRVLTILNRLIQFDSHRITFTDAKGIKLVASIIQNAPQYPEDCVMESASILTKLVTKMTSNEQAYSKYGLQLLLELKKQNPENDILDNLLVTMIHHSATIGMNMELVLQSGCDKLLLSLVKESRVKEVLVKACAALVALCTKLHERVVRSIVSSKVVVHLLNFLKLNQQDLSINAVKIISAVVSNSESGILEIQKADGIGLLVAILSENDAQLLIPTLQTFIKVLFAGPAYAKNIDIFFAAEGERVLVDLLFHENTEVQLLSIDIIKLLTVKLENREIFREIEFPSRFQDLQQNKNIQNDPIMKNSLKDIIANFRKDGDDKHEKKTPDKRQMTYWLPIQYQTKIKIFPIRETLTFADFTEMIKLQFKISSWDRVTVRHNSDEIEITDQRTLLWLIFCLKSNSQIQVDVQPPVSVSVGKTVDKIDETFRQLTHRQLRILLKEATDKGVDLKVSLKDELTKVAQQKSLLIEERLQCTPFGANPDGDAEPDAMISERQVTMQAAASSVAAKLGTTTSAGGSESQFQGSSGSWVNSTISAPPGTPAPPPLNVPAPPPLMAHNKEFRAGGAVKASGNVKGVSSIEDAVKIRRDNIQAAQDVQKKKVLIADEADLGTSLFRINKSAYIEDVHKILINYKNFFQVVLLILERSQIEFRKAADILKVNSSLFENVKSLMQRCGFSVTYSRFKFKSVDDDNTTNNNNNEEIKEFKMIISQYDVPCGAVLKLIHEIIRANWSNREGGPMTDDVKNLLVKYKEAGSQVAAQTQWGKKQEVKIGSLWDS